MNKTLQGLWLIAALSLPIAANSTTVISASLSAASCTEAGGVCGAPIDYTQTASSGALTVPTLSTSVIASSPAGWTDTGNASGAGYVTFGEITGSVSASASESWSAQPPGVNYNNTSSSSNFQGNWQDSLTVTSATLATGTPVNLMFTLAASAGLSCSGQGSVSFASSFQFGSQSISSGSNVCNSAINQKQSLVVSTTVGATLAISGSAQLVAVANGINFQPGSTTVDPPSASFFIADETANTAYTTGSGTSYISPVPLPASAWLMLSGLGGLGFMARKRRGLAA